MMREFALASVSMLPIYCHEVAKVLAEVIFSFVPEPATVLLLMWAGVCVEVCVGVKLVVEPPTHVSAAMPALFYGPAGLLIYIHLVELLEIVPLILCVVYAVCVP